MATCFGRSCSHLQASFKNRTRTLVCAQYGIPYVYMCLYMQGKRTSVKIYYITVKQRYVNLLSWTTRKLPFLYHYVTDFNWCSFTLHVQTHVNIWDPILCVHQGTCSVFKTGLKMAAWAAETCRHTLTNFIVTFVKFVVSRRKKIHSSISFTAKQTFDVTQRRSVQFRMPYCYGMSITYLSSNRINSGTCQLHYTGLIDTWILLDIAA